MVYSDPYPENTIRVGSSQILIPQSPATLLPSRPTGGVLHELGDDLLLVLDVPEDGSQQAPNALHPRLGGRRHGGPKLRIDVERIG